MDKHKSDVDFSALPVFNRIQAETVLERLNIFLSRKIDLVEFMRFLNDDDNITDIDILPKKQRFVIIIINALASTLHSRPELQECFLSRMRDTLAISEDTWHTETCKIRKASMRRAQHIANYTVNRVSSTAMDFRDAINDALGVPDEKRL